MNELLTTYFHEKTKIPNFHEVLTDLHNNWSCLFLKNSFVPKVLMHLSYPQTYQGRRKRGGWGPVFGQTVNPIATRRVDYTHHITRAPRIFRPCDGPAYEPFKYFSQLENLNFVVFKAA